MNPKTVNIDEIMTVAKELPLCSYFLETRKTASSKTVLSWIKTCDEDTLRMINKIFDDLISKSQADVFDKKPEDETYHDSYEYLDIDIHELLNDNNDLILLTALILAWEQDTKIIKISNLNKAITELAVYVSMEILRRMKLIRIKGKGCFFDDSVRFFPVKDGDKKAAKILKSMSTKK